MLFVQKGKTAIFDGKILKINQAAKYTVYFSDRPQRNAGHISNADFVKLWNSKKQKNSFAKDSPNAVLSYYDNGVAKVAIIELSNLKVMKGSISYEVKLLKGKIAPNLQEVALFIDPLEIVEIGIRPNVSDL